MDIKKVLTTVRYKNWHLEKLLDALYPAEVVIADTDDDDAVREGLKGADVAILCGDLDDRILECDTLRWIHCDHAGLNGSARPEIFQRDLRVTGSAGRSAPVLVEHILFLALSLIYHGPAMMEAQKRHEWRGAGNYEFDRGMYGKTMGIIGMGYTGKEMAVRAKQMGMRVLGYDRLTMDAPQGVDTFYSLDNGDGIDPLLKKSDILVLCCHLSDETYHMINSDAFAKMKPTALLINMARGGVVDHDALYEALKNGTISGCGSDVFEPEPLPADSPLWDVPNMIITPHCTPEMPDMTARCLDIIVENIRRYRADEPLNNQLVARDVFTAGRGKLS